ncbi:MAG: hypothetical protein AM325_013245 [Candidatus Thorarchaeota archaeon SMTZ1-45]
MELSDLVEGYELLRSTSQLDPLYSETGRTVLLHDDGYVRVYLTKGPDKWEEISLEIDVFMGIGRSPESDQSRSINDNADDVSLSRSQLIECISYIEYMLRLEEAGFNLEVVLDGCIWTARYTIGRNPDSQLLRTIAPPNHYDSGERK